MARRVVVFVACVVLAACGAFADVLVLKSGARYEGRVVEDGDRYVVITPRGSRLPFPKRLVERVIRQAAPRFNPEVDRFLRGLRAKSSLVRRITAELQAAVERLRRRHAREVQAAGDPFERIVAEARVTYTQQAVARFRGPNPPQRVEMVRRVSARGNTRAIRIVVTPATADAVLAEAREAVRRLGETPEERSRRHAKELAEYEVVGRLAAAAEQVIADARKAVAADAGKAEIARWTKAVDEAVSAERTALDGAKAKLDRVEKSEPSMPIARRVALVINTASKNAAKIARNYCRARGVPASNLIRVRTPVGSEISRDAYNRAILEPVRRYLKSHPHTTMLLLVRGIPWRIPESGRSKNKRRYYGWDRASVDSELALARYGPYKLEGRFRNPLYKKGYELLPDDRILGVCRLDGPTDRIANDLVRRAMAAERRGVQGIAFFDARGLKKGGYVMGDRAILRAADLARKDGRLEVKVDTAGAVVDPSTLKEKIGFYYGWYAGHFRPKDKAFRFGRGAVAAHLHSFAGYDLWSTTKYWVGPLLAHGATATVGTVDEPLLDGFPTADGLVAALLAGRNFAEAALSADRYLSWMSVHVGDPLYRPFPPKK